MTTSSGIQSARPSGQPRPQPTAVFSGAAALPSHRLWRDDHGAAGWGRSSESPSWSGRSGPGAPHEVLGAYRRGWFVLAVIAVLAAAAAAAVAVAAAAAIAVRRPAAGSPEAVAAGVATMALAGPPRVPGA